MQKTILKILFLLALVLALNACAAQPSASDFKDPTVTLKQVQVVNYFDPPWAGWPAAVPTPTPPPAGTPAALYVPFPGAIRVPMILAFIWEVNNPNDYPVTLEQMKYTMELEGAPLKPGEFFAVQTPIMQERQSIPAKTANAIRVVTVLDSTIVNGALAVAYGQRLGPLGVTTTQLLSNWWTNLPDFKFKVKASGGTADFTAGAVKKVVAYEGVFPK